MKSKRLFQIFVLLALLFHPFGNDQPARASTTSVDGLDAANVDPDSFALQNVTPAQPTLSMVVSPSSIQIGGMATVTVNLNNVPQEGYTSAELTCTYNPNLVEASNIVIAGLFGGDPVVAINGPHNGLFIVAIAGGNGSKATTDGPIMTFN
ncbi:MAG TPA: cohesin domain-containing protein, partial [Anaerolineales bacterium]|nr:cohesin domain-containing protein [Anaerolineales bacterium]